MFFVILIHFSGLSKNKKQTKKQQKKPPNQTNPPALADWVIHPLAD
jgi:hypothetical protein